MLARQVAKSKRPIATAGAVTRMSSRWFMRRPSFPASRDCPAHYTTKSGGAAGGAGCAGTARLKSEGGDWQIAQQALRLNVEGECLHTRAAHQRMLRLSLPGRGTAAG